MGKSVVFIYPLSDNLQKLKDTISSDDAYTIYEIDQMSEYNQLIPSIGASLTISSDAKKLAKGLLDNKKAIKKHSSKALLLSVNKLPFGTVEKLQKIGLNDILYEPIVPKTLLYKVGLLAKSLRDAVEKKHEDVVIKNKAEVRKNEETNIEEKEKSAINLDQDVKGATDINLELEKEQNEQAEVSNIEDIPKPKNKDIKLDLDGSTQGKNKKNYIEDSIDGYGTPKKRAIEIEEESSSKLSVSEEINEDSKTQKESLELEEIPLDQTRSMDAANELQDDPLKEKELSSVQKEELKAIKRSAIEREKKERPVFEQNTIEKQKREKLQADNSLEIPELDGKEKENSPVEEFLRKKREKKALEEIQREIPEKIDVGEIVAAMERRKKKGLPIPEKIEDLKGEIKEAILDEIKQEKERKKKEENPFADSEDKEKRGDLDLIEAAQEPKQKEQLTPEEKEIKKREFIARKKLERELKKKELQQINKDLDLNKKDTNLDILETELELKKKKLQKNDNELSKRKLDPKLNLEELDEINNNELSKIEEEKNKQSDLDLDIEAIEKDKKNKTPEKEEQNAGIKLKKKELDNNWDYDEIGDLAEAVKENGPEETLDYTKLEGTKAFEKAQEELKRKRLESNYTDFGELSEVGAELKIDKDKKNDSDYSQFEKLGDGEYDNIKKTQEEETLQYNEKNHAEEVEIKIQKTYKEELISRDSNFQTEDYSLDQSDSYEEEIIKRNENSIDIKTGKKFHQEEEIKKHKGSEIIYTPGQLLNRKKSGEQTLDTTKTQTKKYGEFSNEQEASNIIKSTYFEQNIEVPVIMKVTDDEIIIEKDFKVYDTKGIEYLTKIKSMHLNADFTSQNVLSYIADKILIRCNGLVSFYFKNPNSKVFIEKYCAQKDYLELGIYLKQSWPEYFIANYEKWETTTVPEWMDATFQSSTNTFFYPFFENENQIGYAVINCLDQIKSDVDAKNIEVILEGARCYFLYEYHVEKGIDLAFAKKLVEKTSGDSINILQKVKGFFKKVWSFFQEAS